MIVSELIEWLKTQDQGATVEIVYHSSGTGYYDQGGTAHVTRFDPLKHSEYTDYIKDRTLLLGVYNS